MARSQSRNCSNVITFFVPLNHNCKLPFVFQDGNSKPIVPTPGLSSGGNADPDENYDAHNNALPRRHGRAQEFRQR